MGYINMKEQKKQKKSKKKLLDINDKSKWGHRFEIRNRKQVVRDFFTEKPLPMKRPKSDNGSEKTKYIKQKIKSFEPVPQKRKKKCC